MDNQLHLAPIKPDPHKILDLGTGTGIWAIDMAEKYPSALVIGADTAAVQPHIVPPNLQFEIEDIEMDWLWGENSFDFMYVFCLSTVKIQSCYQPEVISSIDFSLLKRS
jgi:trans-aconitate methyltransferase